LRYEGKDIVRVKYLRRREGKEEVHDTDGDMWHGMTYDGSVVPLQEEVILNQFGEKFVDECKKMSNKRTVPTDEDGYLVAAKMDVRKIGRVRFCPTNKSGEQWIGMLEGKTTEVRLTEDYVERQFGNKFKEECEMLGRNKFLPIPIGSCKSSIMKMFPELYCQHAPAMQYRQEGNSCVLSSLASAFHSTGIEELQAIALILHKKTKQLSDSMGTIIDAKNIVEQHARWLQPKKVPRSFDCLKDMNNYMFVLCVLKDSGNSSQHAVTIFRNWVFDSNEPYALPLCKHSLDLCTWDVRDGVVYEESSFVSIKKGWIFFEDELKKRKILEKCKILTYD
jgi:hypothetical protein